MINFKRFPIEPYKDALYLFCPCSKDGAKAWVKRRKLVDDACDGITYHTSIGNLIFMHEFTDTPESIGVLAHELLHATFNVLNERGVKEEAGNEEAAAYLLDTLISKSLKWLRAQSKPTPTESDAGSPPASGRTALRNA
jgi:hypothetical protein